MNGQEQPDLAQMLRDLRQGAIQETDIYSTIHELGRGEYLEARLEIEKFLTHENPSLRYVALEVLTHHFYLEEHWETARNFLESDPDADCRRMGASSLGWLRKASQDPRSLVVLARVVRNDQEERSVRETAYRALRGIIHYDFREQFRIASMSFDLERDVDWAWVDSFL